MLEPSFIGPKTIRTESENYIKSNTSDVSKSDKNNCCRQINRSKITLREKEVLQLLGNGDSSKMIAQKLHISETTAITHRKNLIQKLNVRNTAHLIKVAVLSKILA